MPAPKGQGRSLPGSVFASVLRTASLRSAPYRQLARAPTSPKHFALNVPCLSKKNEPECFKFSGFKRVLSTIKIAY